MFGQDLVRQSKDSFGLNVNFLFGNETSHGETPPKVSLTCGFFKDRSRYDDDD